MSRAAAGRSVLRSRGSSSVGPIDVFLLLLHSPPVPSWVRKNSNVLRYRLTSLWHRWSSKLGGSDMRWRRRRPMRRRQKDADRPSGLAACHVRADIALDFKWPQRGSLVRRSRRTRPPGQSRPAARVCKGSYVSDHGRTRSSWLLPGCNRKAES